MELQFVSWTAAPRRIINESLAGASSLYGRFIKFPFPRDISSNWENHVRSKGE